MLWRAHDLDGEVVCLFDRYRSPLLRYVAGFGIAFSDGEEIVQETFLSLFQHLAQRKSRQNLPGWLFRVAHNLALRRRRRALRETLSRNVPEQSVDPGPDPEKAFFANQDRRRILAAVQALPEKDRQCLFLRAEGMRYREISEALKISVGSVSISLARSLARIARATGR